jgi:hypothetical protein
VRPEEAGPAISLRAPRGKPPIRESRVAIPVETVKGAARSRSNSVEERRAPSDASIRERVEREPATNIFGGVMATDDMKNLRRAKRTGN